jgi:hypothetical protein
VVVRGVTSTKSRRRDASRSRGRESRSRLSAPDRLTSTGVGNEAAVDHVGELPLERPQRFLLALALGELAAEEDLTGGGVADLGDRGDVDGGVELAVAAPVEAVPLDVARGRFDGGGAGVAAKCPAERNRRRSPTIARMVAALMSPIPKMPVSVEPWAWSASCRRVSTAGMRRLHQRQSSSSCLAISRRSVSTSVAGRTERRILAALVAVSFLGAPPGTISESSACSRQMVRCRKETRCQRRSRISSSAWEKSSSSTVRSRPGWVAAIATERASWSSVLRPELPGSLRVRCESDAGTSTTCSPAMTSCWETAGRAR